MSSSSCEVLDYSRVADVLSREKKEEKKKNEDEIFSPSWQAGWLASKEKKKEKTKRKRNNATSWILELLHLRDDGSPWLWTNRLKKKKERKRGNHCPSWWSKFANRLRKGVAQDAA